MPNTLANATKPVDTSNMTLITPSAPTAQSPQLNASADPEFSALALAPIPPVLGTDTDAQRQFYRRGVSQLRMPPLPSQAKIAIGATAQSQVINQQFIGGGGPDLMVNNVANPVQNILNITGPGVSYGPAKGQVQIGGSSEPQAPYLQIQGEPQVGAPGANVFITNFLNGGANGVGGFLFSVPFEIPTGNIIFDIGGADTTNSYDIGVYGPLLSGSTSMSLVVNTGPTIYPSAITVKVPWLQGTTIITPGTYFMFFTSAGSLFTLGLTGWLSFYSLYSAYSVTLSASSTLPAEADVPVISESFSAYLSGHAGAGIPQRVAMTLTA